MIELLRRLLLLSGFGLAAWHIAYTPDALIAVRLADPAGETRTLPARPAPPPAGLTARFTYFAADDPRVAPFDAPLRASLARTGFLNAYTTLSGTGVELMIFPEPGLSSAPSSVLHPKRGGAWLFAVAALALYLLLGLAGRSTAARHDPLPLAVLDVVVSAAAAFFFVLPGLFFQALGVLMAGALFWLASRAAWRLEATETSLRLRTLLTSTEVPLASIAAAVYRLSEDGSERTGLDLRLADGRSLSIPWAGLIDFLPVFDNLCRHGLLPERRAALMDS